MPEQLSVLLIDDREKGAVLAQQRLQNGAAEAAGQDVTSTFGILPATLSGSLTAVDGTGVLPPNSTGTAQWTLIPTIDAAPQSPTNYLVSGTFSYLQNGVTITIPLAPAAISVQPNPQLYVKYFHQRDVFADDPYTPEIEPSIPYSLGVMVQNHGYGMARDFKITSAQPKIVDNEKGLLIDFKIIGAQVGNQPVAPSLTVDFGDIAPGEFKVGRWLLTSTLQGLFIDYKATFQHVDPLGNPRLSLVDGVEIHEMTHLVRADGAWDDGLPDFLVKLSPKLIYVVETKGREELDLPLKMQRLRQWCEDISRVQSDVKWDFVYVDQEGFEKYKPTSFSQLIGAFKEYKKIA